MPEGRDLQNRFSGESYSDRKVGGWMKDWVNSWVNGWLDGYHLAGEALARQVQRGGVPALGDRPGAGTGWGKRQCSGA